LAVSFALAFVVLNFCSKTKAQTRCNIKKDAGLTRANTTGIRYCCLFFSRGCCPYGWECEYLHSLPDPERALPDSSKDCFARDKFSDYRDDMGGVGTFTRQNRTLYVGRIKETGAGPETEEVVRRHFKEWGDIEHSASPLYLRLALFLSQCGQLTTSHPTLRTVRVLQYRSVAFVTYVSEHHAQFAKEAMACQSLDNDEILNVRWATEDPNPTSKVAEKRRLEEIGRAAIRARMDPRVVDAMHAVRALEEGQDYHANDDAVDEDLDMVVDGPEGKRRRIEGPENPDEPEVMEEPSEPQEPEPERPQGLLSAETLESLRFFSEIRRQNGAAPAPSPAPAAKVQRPVTAGLGLGDYGSDDED
jgi:Torus domain